MLLIPHSWKFLNNKNFEVFRDFDLSSKKTLNNKVIYNSCIDFNICSLYLIIKNLFLKSWKEIIFENFVAHISAI